MKNWHGRGGVLVGLGGGGRVFESLLIDGHHLDVGCGFAVDDALLVDFGPAEAEEEPLDGDLGVGGGGGEVLSSPGMKRSRQVEAAWWGGWTSSIRGS